MSLRRKRTPDRRERNENWRKTDLECRRASAPRDRLKQGLIVDAASWRYLFSLKSLKLDGNGCIGFQEFQQFIVGPFQAVLLPGETQDAHYSNHFPP